MERVSAYLGRIMLSILIVITALALVLAGAEGTESPSYLAALTAGAAAAALLLWLKKKDWAFGSFGRLCRRLGAVNCAVIITGLCFLLGRIWIVLVPVELFSDYKTYWDCAVSIARGQEVYSTEYVAMYPHILGYASFLALFIGVFGEHVLVGVLLGLLLSCLSGLLIFSITRDAAGLPAAVLAGGLWALYPGRILLGSLIFRTPVHLLGAASILAASGSAKKTGQNKKQDCSGPAVGSWLGLAAGGHQRRAAYRSYTHHSFATLAAFAPGQGDEGGQALALLAAADGGNGAQLSALRKALG